MMKDLSELERWALGLTLAAIAAVGSVGAWCVASQHGEIACLEQRVDTFSRELTNRPKYCSYCDGTGRQQLESWVSADKKVVEASTCPLCQGSGTEKACRPVPHHVNWGFTALELGTGTQGGSGAPTGVPAAGGR
jgi:hypothetical protein